MNNHYLKYFLFIFFIIAGRTAFGQEVDSGLCGHFNEYKALKLSPEYAQIKQAENKLLIESNEFLSLSRRKKSEKIVIPVVFHIVHGNGDEDVSADQITDALRILNEDFNLSASKKDEIHENFKGIAASVGVEFKLAQKNPQGDSADGVERYYRRDLTSSADLNELRAEINWPRESYLNIWVIRSLPNGSAGVSNYPTSTIGSKSTNDGVVLAHWSLGSIGTSRDGYEKTLTHEVGHWLNLKHTWGDDTAVGDSKGCGFDDGVEDTPNTIGNQGCVEGFESRSCGSLDNVQNFMDYTTCGAMFTEGQKNRMLAALHSNIAHRKHLWTEENLIATGLNEGLQVNFLVENSTLRINQALNIIDKSSVDDDLVESWNWRLDGATPSEFSGKELPAVYYSNIGEYEISLIVEMKSGEKVSVSRSVEVTNDIVMGITKEAYVSEAKFYDNGYKEDYLLGSDHTITIYPLNANKRIAVDFFSFHLEEDFNCGYDYLDIFDGENTSAPFLGRYCGRNNPGMLQAQGSSGALTFRFVSDASNEHAGWEARVFEMETPSGIDVQLTANKRFPLPEEQIVFADMSVIGEEIEIKTWLWNFEGADISFFEGEMPPPISIDREGDFDVSLAIEDIDGNFYSKVFKDFIRVRENFRMNDEVIITDAGEFYDSGGPFSNYSSGENSVMTFYPVNEGDAVRMEFVEFQLDLGDCAFDYLEVFDGSSTDAPLIGRFCARDKVVNVGKYIQAMNAEGALTFRFISNQQFVSSGWKAIIDNIPMNGISVNINKPDDVYINQSTDLILSTNILNENISIDHVVWETEGADVFEHIGNDQVTVTYPEKGIFDITLRVHLTSGEELEYLFEDFMEVNDGFDENFQEIRTCSGRFYGNVWNYSFGPGEYSVTTIYPRESGNAIKLDFDKFLLTDSENCESEYVMIYDGVDMNAPLIGKYCGEEIPESIIALNSYGALTIVYYSDQFISFPEMESFSANISCVDQPQSLKAFFESNRQIIPVGGSVDFNHLLNESSKSIVDDYRWNFSGATVEESMEENPINIVYNELGNFNVKLTVKGDGKEDSHEVSDYIQVTDQFAIGQSYSEMNVCGGYFYDNGFDDEYSGFLDEVVTLYPKNELSVLTIDFEEFNIEYSNDCNKDYLEIYDGPNTASKLIGRYCGSESPGLVRSSDATGALTFRFVSDQSNQTVEPGWKAKVSCEQVLFKPIADFDWEDGKWVTVGDYIEFENLTINSSEEYLWFIDGQMISDDKHLEREFENSGSYEVRLTAINKAGEDSIVKIVNVDDLPISEFTMLQSEIFVNDPAQFQVQHNMNHSYEWSFDFGEIIEDESGLVTVNFSAEGMYDASLLVINRAGKSASSTMSLGVLKDPNTGIDSKKKLKVYPNPVEKFLTIEGVERDAIASIALVNVIGNVQKVSTSYNKNKLFVDVSTLKPGIYMLSIIIDGERKAFKIIKK
ncbi:CUB domain-containing protein [Aureibacter tunicatorum]|uniref:PKD repeat protein n=1 Tax=Aureibacter tunicatorum TaxID=866807 RepID=A0AAE3XLL7_9BACT|nr:CUB domain-containing protein [Aureibacter tunicatorum]MDR6240171.1 PKD repeat protein [Aureibacter tunicatorum]BDD05948.1 hypothetical protein AUTU_34310 [Aureibacter tunicatorum]